MFWLGELLICCDIWQKSLDLFEIKENKNKTADDEEDDEDSSDSEESYYSDLEDEESSSEDEEDIPDSVSQFLNVSHLQNKTSSFPFIVIGVFDLLH